jgi:hypothetical protein
VHFGIVAGLLGVFAVGVNPLFDAPLLKLVGWVLRKEPVPWPAGVVVDSTTMRNVSLPTEIGPYHRVEKDGVLFWTAKTDDQGNVVPGEDGQPIRVPTTDGEPDGERIFEEELLSSLKINTSLDGIRHPDRKSNWYVSRIYRDTRPGRQHQLWGLDVYYYTGSADTVAHVPDICGQAGGGTISAREALEAEGRNLPEGWSNWETFDVQLIGILSQSEGRQRQTNQYYVFCANGNPTVDRGTVRLSLADPTRSYVYFAKAQWYPLDGVPTPEATDDEAIEFIETVLPDVLSQLPTPSRLEELETAD